MKNLILVSHGTFCVELKNSVEMIMGEQSNVYAVPLLPAEGQEEFKEKFEAVTADLSDFVVFADLLGGTPANVVSKMLMTGADFELYAGMNMPMIISFINSQLIGGELEVVSAGQEAIVKVNDLLNASMDDDEDE